jgi:hypothetical protein
MLFFSVTNASLECCKKNHKFYRFRKNNITKNECHIQKNDVIKLFHDAQDFRKTGELDMGRISRLSLGLAIKLASLISYIYSSTTQYFFFVHLGG